MPTLTVTYPVELQTALTRAFAEHGASVVEDLVTNWLQDQDRAFEDADIRMALAGKADAATKAKLRVKLGL